MREKIETDKIYHIIDQHKVISFDAFDTLLLRPWSVPCHLFDYIEEKYQVRGFSKARNSVVVEGIKEKSIDDIYRVIDNSFNDLINVELKEEENTIYANSAMKSIYDYAINSGKIVVITSDIYFHHDFMRAVLEKNGYKKFNRLYCSCDYQETKCSGELFDRLLREFDVTPSQVLHIGDDKVSDYALPVSKGLDAILIEKNIEKYLSYKGYSVNQIKNIDDSIITKVCADNFSQSIDCVEEEKAWYRFGFDAAGPICYTFTQWINSIISNGGYQTLHLLHAMGIC